MLIEWIYCPVCGSDAEGLIDCKKDGYFYDGDDARCTERCGEEGVFVTDEYTSFVSWNNQQHINI